MPTDTRVMAVDYGDVRTGIAVSDISATMVGDAWVLHEKNAASAARTITNEAALRSVRLLVVGYPRNMDGTAGSRAVKCEQFAELLRTQCGIEVTLWDERMTTVSAHQILSNVGKYGKKRRKQVDAVAAALILESYLKFMIASEKRV